MAIDNEQLKSVIGIPNPKAVPDNETLRAVAGVASFGDADGTGGNSFSSPLQGPFFSPAFSPANPPIIGIR